MEMLFEFLWKIIWQTAIIATVVWVITRLTKKAPATWRHALWMVVLIKFLIPPFAYLPSELAPQKEPAPNTSAYAVQTSSPVSSPSDYVLPDANAPIPKPGGRTINETAAIVLLNPSRLIVSAWLIGFFASIFALMVRYRRQKWLIAFSRETNDEHADLLRECADTLGMSRLPRTLFSDQAVTPMLIGLRHPVILLPTGITNSCSRSDLKAMLMHELAHVKRRDMIVIWLYQLVQMLFFFHPAVWLAGYELKREREIACDELVLSTSGITPQDYASGYVLALRLANGVSSSVTALGMAEPFNIEKKRMDMILRNAIPRMSAAWICGLVVVIAVGLPTFAGIGAKSSSKVELPENGPALLDTLIAGSKHAAEVITSGKGTAVVQEASVRDSSGAATEYEKVYNVTFTGSRYRMSVESKMLRNDVRTDLGIHPVKPGTKYLREVAIDGDQMAEMAINQHPGFPATAVLNGHGRIKPTENSYTRTDSRSGNLHVYRYTSDIALNGEGIPGNGIIDISSLTFEKNPYVKKVITRLAGREVINGSECIIVEKKVICSSKEHPDWLLRVWVDPSRGFTVPKLRWYCEGIGYPKRTLRATSDVQLRRYAHGVWGPAKVFQEFYGPDRSTGKIVKERSTTITYDKDFRVNISIPEKDLELVLPPGTRVHDEASGKRYHIPSDGDPLVVSVNPAPSPSLQIE